MAEQIDIFDANLQKIGEMERREAHYQGQWHRTFHCWLYRGTPEPQMLLQLRAPRMKNFPEKLDVSAAGHLDSGEEPIDGLREIKEELGIDVRQEDLLYAGERVEVADQDNGQKNREYQSVYLLRYEPDRPNFTPDPDEVWGLFWISIADGLNLFSGRRATVEMAGMEFDPQTSKFLEKVRTCTVKDFVPRIQRYYVAAMINIDRALSGMTDVAIS
ncbi:NUDIX domain-containing protein [Acidipropionibacterium jensenii]|uniref:NUDIX domain-containing protein n=1 Tax=Acidipropionibacterium jensenii TaxID=1749 RepID=A0A3Q9UKS9_9ACTN|nr:NUDIX domain-containing protein [Acidipropionibacterium jensenii]AZZ39725.1 NUDIX domain-containing protein [Acidipropionibacterium jensenii]